MSKNPAAVALGRLGGKSTSERKAAAARKNGQKGGWPKGKRRKVRPVNLEPMTVRTELRDSKGRKVQGARTHVVPSDGSVYWDFGKPLPPGKYLASVKLSTTSGAKGTPRKGKKGKR